MCSICHSSPCLSGCPNAPDPPAAFRCHDCDEAIYPGDEYAKIDGVEYCEQCIHEGRNHGGVSFGGGRANCL